MRDCKDRKLEAGDRVEIPALYDDGGKVVHVGPDTLRIKWKVDKVLEVNNVIESYTQAECIIYGIVRKG